MFIAMTDTFSHAVSAADHAPYGYNQESPSSNLEKPAQHEFWHMLCYYYTSQGPVIFFALTMGVLVVTCLKWTLENTQRYRALSPKEIDPSRQGPAPRLENT